MTSFTLYLKHEETKNKKIENGKSQIKNNEIERTTSKVVFFWIFE